MSAPMRQVKTMSRGRRHFRELRIRRCIVTGERYHQDRLLRFIADDCGRLKPDIARSGPGRGMWVSCSRRLLERAISRNLFLRASRRKLEVPVDLADRVDGELACRLLRMLANSGCQKPATNTSGRDCPDTGDIHFLPSSGGSSVRCRPEFGTVFTCLTESELGTICGPQQDCRIHLPDSGIARRIRLEAMRLSNYRAHDGL